MSGINQIFSVKDWHLYSADILDNFEMSVGIFYIVILSYAGS